MSRRDFIQRQDAELRWWPGVRWKRRHRGKHMALVLTFKDRSQFVVYPDTPSECRAVHNHIATVRQVCRALGARREGR